MKEFYNTTIKIENLDEAKYDMLMDFLQDNNMNYEETDFEEFVIDERTEDEKYQDWLSDEADAHNEEKWMEE